MRLLPLLLLAMLMISAASAEGTGGIKLPEQDLDWRSVNRCGPNALYVILFMHGLKPDYNKIISGMTITPQGASVADIVRSSEDNGLPLVAIKANVEDLAQFSMPTIVHYQPPGELGHYAVLLRVNPDKTFSTIEATRGKVEVQSTGDFLSKWSGVVLIRKSDWIAWEFERILFLLFVIVTIILLFFVAWAFLTHGRGRQPANQKDEPQAGVHGAAEVVDGSVV